MATKRAAKVGARREGWVAVEPLLRHTGRGPEFTRPGHPATFLEEYQAKRLEKRGAVRWAPLPTPEELEELDRPPAPPPVSGGLSEDDVDLGPEDVDAVPPEPGEVPDADDVRASLMKLSPSRFEKLARERGVSTAGRTRAQVVDEMTGRREDPTERVELDPATLVRAAPPIHELDYAAVYGLARKIDLAGRDDMTEPEMRAALEELQGAPEKPKVPKKVSDRSDKPKSRR